MNFNPEQLTQHTYYRGRVAMHALLRACGVCAGDEVALQAFTCVAVPEGVIASGAQPIFVDLEKGGVNMAPADLERRITKRTRAIVVQHTFGIPAAIDAILAVAAQRSIPVIEDCCHVIASTFHGRPLGTWGSGSFFSFEWGKPLVTGIGGSAWTARDDVTAQLDAIDATLAEPPAMAGLRLHLQRVAHRILYRPRLYWPVRAIYHLLGRIGAAQSNYNVIGTEVAQREFTYRMSSALLPVLREEIAAASKRSTEARIIAEGYRSGIRNPNLRTPIVRVGSDVVYARYPLLVTGKTAMLAFARQASVELADWYATPVHPLRAHEWATVGYVAGSCPEAEQRCAEIVSLPVHRAVGQRDVRRTCRFLNGLA